MQKLYNFTHRAVIPNAGVCKAHIASTKEAWQGFTT